MIELGTAVVIFLAAALFLADFTLGLLVQFRAVGTKPSTLALFAVLPYVRTGTLGHAALTFYAAGFIRSL